MALDSNLEQRARWLLLSVVDGDATEAERTELNELVRADAELRQSVVRFLCDGSYIASTIESNDQVAKLRAELAALGAAALGPATCQAEIPGRSTGFAPSQSDMLRTGLLVRAMNRVASGLRMVDRHGLVVAMAASLVVMALGWQYLAVISELHDLHAISARPDPVQNERRGEAPEAAAAGRGSSGAARVTGVVNCAWPVGVDPLKFGDLLSLGERLQLQTGLIQLTFETGAKVVVEGPSDFVVGSPNSATLEEGKLAAVIPQAARGYTIFTPTAEVVDLGTEFGVAVDEQGLSEIHVFDGDVIARPRHSDRSTAKLIHARQDEALQFDAATDEGRRILADRQKFVRRLVPEPASEDLPQLPVSKDLVLWLAADIMPEAKVGTSVATWPDILMGDNRFPDDAWQFDERRCPTWIRDARGLPAVQFDGWATYVATSPMATGDQITAFVVFAPGPTSFASDFHGGMLLKFGSYTPSLEYSLMPDRRVKARVWAKDKNGAPSYASAVQGAPLKPHEICASAYAYDVPNDRAELFLNGASQGATNAQRPLEQLARKYVGAHPEPWWDAYFLGSIYEVIVYDAVLSESDRNLVFQYLSTRYGTPVSM
jgi:hypothetical protein